MNGHVHLPDGAFTLSDGEILLLLAVATAILWCALVLWRHRR